MRNNPNPYEVVWLLALAGASLFITPLVCAEDLGGGCDVCYPSSGPSIQDIHDTQMTGLVGVLLAVAFGIVGSLMVWWLKGKK